MKRLLGRFSNSRFLRDSLTVFSGTTFAQALPLLAAPVLARLYEPGHYGMLAIYISLVGLLGIFATLQYSSAVLLPEKEEDAQAVVGLCLLLTCAASLIVALLVAVFAARIAAFFDTPRLALWLWFAPISILLNGVTDSLSAYASRRREFRLLSVSRVLASAGAVGTSLAIGALMRDPVGLFAGLWVSQAIGSLFLSYRMLRRPDLPLRRRPWAALRAVARKYSNFPRYTAPAALMNNFANQAPVFLLATYASAAAVGFYSMSNRLLGLPVAFVSSAIGEVFRQRAARDYAAHGTCRPVFLKTFKTLLSLSIVPFFILIYWGPDIFAVVLGEKWRNAGTYAQLMGIMFFFRFVVSPLTSVYYLADRQREDFILHFLFVAVTLSSFYVGLAVLNSAAAALLMFSIGYSAVYAIYLIRSFMLSAR